MNPTRLLSIALLAGGATVAQAQRRFPVDETTIADVHAAMRAGSLTCHALVQTYLDRIDAYDKKGPSLNAITVVNPDALRTADSLDNRFRATRQFVGPLHCIPMLVKDNMQTIGLQTAVGNIALKGYKPTKDAFEVKRVKQAGAIVLAKTNMAEFAFSPLETVNSLQGYTHNPYDTSRVTAGSSGGTAAGVAANLGEVGLGTDTGNSIRGPSSHQALVGIRSTMGLTSRAGIAPLNLNADIAGPMARTVADAVAVFQAVVGYDPDDPATEAVKGKPIPNYADFLKKDGLRGARIGVLGQAFEGAPVDSEVRALFDRALGDLRTAGATVVETVIIPGADSIRRSGPRGCSPFRYEINHWLAEQGPTVPVKSIDSIANTPGLYHPSIEQRLKSSMNAPNVDPDSIPACVARERVRMGLRSAVERTMDSLRLDALVYPTWSFPPRPIGDMKTPAGDNSQVYSPTTGNPAITVPMGYSRDNRLPAGMTIFGRAFDEGRLIRIAYAYEQATKWRKEPTLTPPLR
jgi:Asp-tRNA(Asn)/Glu-tRNA(Gln) amidotransferase A subunit family amidase